MSEPEAILARIDALLDKASKPLAGKHVVITAGPTHEPIDPVRYIANRSSGKQGYALAEAARAAGARVTLVSGPVTLDVPLGVDLVRVETAAEMHEAVAKGLPLMLPSWRQRSQTGAWPIRAPRKSRKSPMAPCRS